MTKLNSKTSSEANNNQSALSANQRKQIEISDKYDCKPFNLNDPVAFVKAYNKFYGYTFHPKGRIKHNDQTVDNDGYIAGVKREINCNGMRNNLPFSFIEDDISNQLRSINEEIKNKYIESISNPTKEEIAEGKKYFDMLADHFLGINRERPGFEMEKCTLYTWMAQAKYKILHGFNQHMTPIAIHIYSNRKNLGKSFVMHKLLGTHSDNGIGIFSTETSSANLLDTRNVSLIKDHNIIMLDDFEGIKEDQQEAWKSIITKPIETRRVLGSSTKYVELNIKLALLTVGNYELKDMIYNELRERRMIQLHVDGETEENKPQLPSDIFENIDYDAIWKSIDEKQYNLVWEKYRKEVELSQENQTSETWFDDFIGWMIEEKTIINEPITLRNLYKNHYLTHCNDYSYKNNTQKTLAKKLKIHPDLLGYGSAKHYSSNNTWKIKFDYRAQSKPSDLFEDAVNNATISAKLNQLRGDLRKGCANG